MASADAGALDRLGHYGGMYHPCTFGLSFIHLHPTVTVLPRRVEGWLFPGEDILRARIFRNLLWLSP